MNIPYLCDCGAQAIVPQLKQYPTAVGLDLLIVAHECLNCGVVLIPVASSKAITAFEIMHGATFNPPKRIKS